MDPLVTDLLSCNLSAAAQDAAQDLGMTGSSSAANQSQGNNSALMQDAMELVNDYANGDHAALTKDAENLQAQGITPQMLMDAVAASNPSLSQAVGLAASIGYTSAAAANAASQSSGDVHAAMPIASDPTSAVSDGGENVGSSNSNVDSIDDSGGQGSGWSVPSQTSNQFAGMSPEEIVEALLSQATDGLEDQMEGLATKLDDAESKLVSAQSSTDNSQQAQAQKAQAQKDVDTLTRQLQQVMEQRTAMFNLLSNMEKAENDMAMTAIKNLGAL